MLKTLLVSLLLMATVSPNTVHKFVVNDIDGTPVLLKKFKGKKILIVNTASQCGFTKQYAELEKLYETYKDKGFVIVGVPANNFASQEPGTNEEIKKFCTNKYNVSFPMMSKVSVKGDDITPLYVYLTDKSTDPKLGGEIKWNFTKFIFDRNGNPVARFEPNVTPESPEVVAAVESALK